jgi:hypothetical protein
MNRTQIVDKLLRPTPPIPEQENGRFLIQKFHISPAAADFENMKMDIRSADGLLPESQRFVLSGDYIGLYRKGENGSDAHILMSDTRAEVYDHVEPVRHAKGNVFISGLGLGIVTQACLRKPEVESVTVMDISHEVISMVGPFIEKRPEQRLELVCADVLDFVPDKADRYDMVWHDIWATIDDRNLGDMMKLAEVWGPRCLWLGFWAQAMVERMAGVRDMAEEAAIAQGRHDEFVEVLGAGVFNETTGAR